VFVFAKEESVKITAIRAQLFYSDSGTLSENIIDKRDFHLWNSGIGEGSAQGPSSKVLVTVELTGTETEGRLLLNAVPVKIKNNQKVLIDTEEEPGFFSKKKYVFPILVSETGCGPISIEAKIKGKPSSLVKKNIQFGCGE